MKRTLTIPAPKAVVGEYVTARNYRTGRSRDARWERGKVTRIAYTPRGTFERHDGSKYKAGGCWHYDVWIDRPVVDHGFKRRGGGYSITVGNDAIRRAA